MEENKQRNRERDVGSTWQAEEHMRSAEPERRYKDVVQNRRSNRRLNRTFYTFFAALNV